MATLQDVKTSYKKIKTEGFDGEELLNWVKKTYAPFVKGIIDRLDWDKDDEYNATYLNTKSQQIQSARATFSSRTAFEKLIQEKTSTAMLTVRKGDDKDNAKALSQNVIDVYSLLSASSVNILKSEVDFSKKIVKRNQFMG